jgi:diacylglycerol kinase (ATP)
MPAAKKPLAPKTLRLVVAINPSASFGNRKGVGPALVSTLRGLGHEVTSLTEPSYAELVEAGRKAVATKPDALIVVGGDGMVSLGVNLVAKTKVPLGIVPSGTGNDMARVLGIPHDNTEAAIASLVASLAAGTRTIDLALITHQDDDGSPTETWFACAISAGFDAIVNDRANHMTHPKGPSRYIIALLIELAKLKPIEYTLTLDGVVTKTKAALVSIGNGVSLGGGMKITPDALVDDGLLDVLVVKPLSRLAFIRIFPRVFKGEHVTDPRVTITRAKRVRIESAGVAAFADGERLGLLPIDVEIVPGALRVYAPLP